MPLVKLLRPALITTLLAAATACSASPAPAPDQSTVSATSTATNSGSAEARRSADATPVAASMPDLTGGNAGRVREQMGAEIDMIFEDASGQGRPVDDPSDWKVCNSQPGPNQQIIDFPVVVGVVLTSEKCEEPMPE
ncbi:hypothetical protein [Streptomyces sp. TRM68416]|uniref:hypothetical protein n=1 Tax=Streptomyces sp. TRM68416 TaxID=2758412 RepID=UPI001661C174|nr:hypothetical protein [Streptomyces sp. TRM68416]MBD0843092.1 hypothetical protein [Streptomyces sp. TRM68416]